MTAAQVRAHTDRMTQPPDPEVPERTRPPRTYPAAYKLRILAEYEQLGKAGKGALLLREGLYTSLISEWRKQRDKGALAALGEGTRRGRPPIDPREREAARAVNRLLDPTNEAPSYFGAHFFFYGAGEVAEGNQIYGTAEMGYAIVGGGVSAGK
jgi:transposase-like protein